MILRNVLAFIGGVFAAGAVIALVEIAGHSFASEAGLFAIVAAGYGLGALAGSAMAARIGTHSWPPMGVALALAAMAILNLFAIAHPVWFIPAAAVALIAGHLAGRRLGGL